MRDYENRKEINHMFTGIIEEVGTIRSIKKGAKSAIITVEASKVLEDVHIGDSI